jgi:hypothetical protein
LCWVGAMVFVGLAGDDVIVIVETTGSRLLAQHIQYESLSLVLNLQIKCGPSTGGCSSSLLAGE